MSEWKGQYIRLAKMGATENPKAPTPLWDDYEHGERNLGSSIPLSYWVEGYLVTDVEPGKCIVIDRKIRNGERIDGAFQTSLIASVTPVANGSLRLETQNSVYILSKAPDQQYSMSGESETNGTPETN